MLTWLHQGTMLHGCLCTVLGFLVWPTGVGRSEAGKEQAVLALRCCAMPGQEGGMPIPANSTVGTAVSKAELFPGRGSVGSGASGGALGESWSPPISCLTGGSFTGGGSQRMGPTHLSADWGWDATSLQCPASLCSQTAVWGQDRGGVGLACPFSPEMGVEG